MELYPDYICTDSEHPEKGAYHCEPKDFCGKESVSETINWDSNTSLHNWVETLDLTCTSSKAIGFIGSAYFAGLMVSVLLFPRLADLFGRRKIILACQFTNVPAYIWIFFMSTLYECYGIFFLIGLGFGGTVSVNTLFVQEFLQKKHRAIVVTTGQTFDSLSVLLLVLYLLVITKHWQGWYIMGLTIQVINIFGYLWMPESPEFLFAKGRFDEAKEVLLWISKVNRRPVTPDMICFDNVGKKSSAKGQVIEDEQHDTSKPHGNDEQNPKEDAEVEQPEQNKKHTTGTLRELWGDKILVINLALMSVLWSTTSFTVYLGRF